jgi:ABC-2 type transport system ATP-binding protein
LKQQIAEQRLDLTLTDSAAFATVAGYLGGRAVRRDPDRLTVGVATDGSAAHVRHLLDEIDPQHHTVRRFVVNTATLDDVFMALTGHAATRPDSADSPDSPDSTARAERENAGV